LTNYGWSFNKNNIPADYLTGLLIGLKAKAKGLEEAILDIGLNSPSKGSGIFALLKGVIDAEIHIPYSEEKIPSEDRIMGEHIQKYIASLDFSSDKSHFIFSKYMKNKISPDKLTEQFENVKNNIIKTFSKVGVKKIEKKKI
jgi:large subunit ribosomal protein L18